MESRSSVGRISAPSTKMISSFYLVSLSNDLPQIIFILGGAPGSSSTKQISNVPSIVFPLHPILALHSKSTKTHDGIASRIELRSRCLLWQHEHESPGQLRRLPKSPLSRETSSSLILPNVIGEPHDRLARSVLLGARTVTSWPCWL